MAKMESSEEPGKVRRVERRVTVQRRGTFPARAALYLGAIIVAENDRRRTTRRDSEDGRPVE